MSIFFNIWGILWKHVLKKKTFRYGTDERDDPLAQIGAQFLSSFPVLELSQRDNSFIISILTCN